MRQGIARSRAAAPILGVLASMVVASCGGTAAHAKPVSVAVRNHEPPVLVGLEGCLRKQDIVLAEGSEKADETVGIGGVLGEGGMRLPRGVTRQRFEAALAKCGLPNIQVAGAPITNPTFRRRILQLATCLRADGFKLPAPDLSGNGPVFDTSGIDITSARWIAAKRTCRSEPTR
jgi:hypothetical protein